MQKQSPQDQELCYQLEITLTLKRRKMIQFKLIVNQ